QKVYARVMNYFVMACAFIFLAVSLHLHILEYLLGASYREGMYIVPVLLFANLFLGIYLNLSIWFKLNEQTWYGLVFTLIGAFFTVTLNIYLIPKFGYTGSAYATLVSYFMMTLGCYIVGQRKYPIPYNLK